MGANKVFTTVNDDACSIRHCHLYTNLQCFFLVLAVDDVVVYDALHVE